MIAYVDVNVFIIAVMVLITLVCLIILSVLRFRLSDMNLKLRKSYAALLINPKHTVDMIIPINEQRKQTPNHYARCTQTETIHPSIQTNDDYYQSILSNSDVPYYPVRETNYCALSRIAAQMNIDVNKGNYLIRQ